MHRANFIAFFTLLAVFAAVLSLNTNADAPKPEPIKVLMITGGGWHDYENQAVILKETIESRLNATVDVKWTTTDEHPVKKVDTIIPHIFTEDFSKGYDVVLHNHCHIGLKDDAAIDKAIDNHIKNKAGVILIHGSFHSFWKTKNEAWDRIAGCNSVKHIHKSGINVKVMDKNHPVTKALGVEGWKTKEGELYTTRLNEGTTNLANGTTYKGKKKTDSCIMSHTMDGCKVMGITLGHHNSTMKQKEYQDLITNSVLWTANKLDAAGLTPTGYRK